MTGNQRETRGNRLRSEIFGQRNKLHAGQLVFLAIFQIAPGHKSARACHTRIIGGRCLRITLRWFAEMPSGGC